MQDKIDKFDGEYRWLSNFWPAKIHFSGLWKDKEGKYLPIKSWDAPTVEHAYQACEAEYFKDAMLILSASTPGKAKSLSKRYPTKPDWDTIKFLVMQELCKLKFKEHPDLAKKLKDTGDAELIEGNTWGDIFWGQVNGKGQNHLGKILMKIRDEL